MIQFSPFIFQWRACSRSDAALHAKTHSLRCSRHSARSAQSTPSMRMSSFVIRSSRYRTRKSKFTATFRSSSDVVPVEGAVVEVMISSSCAVADDTSCSSCSIERLAHLKLCSAASTNSKPSSSSSLLLLLLFFFDAAAAASLRSHRAR